VFRDREHAAGQAPGQRRAGRSVLHPFHPILVTVPIGAWVSGLVFDIASHVIGDPNFLPTQPSSSHFPPAVIFGHFLLAAIGLVLWIVYLVIDNDAVGWATFALLIPVALLGLYMFLRWLPTYGAGAGTTAQAPEPAERHLPVAIVLGHGVLTDLNIGAS
jgi:hypothetical protein